MRKSPQFLANSRKFSTKPTPKVLKIPKPKGPSPIPKQPPGTFPMRINKYLAMKGTSTRRDADELIKKKFVIINGRIALLGDKVEASDIVEVRRNGRSGRNTHTAQNSAGNYGNTDKNSTTMAFPTYVYYAFNKPPGVELETASRNLPLQNVFPVLSLDRAARGLVILTNDRRIIDRLTYVPHTSLASAPSLHVADNARIKEYLIRTHQPLKHNFKEKLEKVSSSTAVMAKSPAIIPSPLALLFTSSKTIFSPSAVPTTAIIYATSALFLWLK